MWPSRVTGWGQVLSTLSNALRSIGATGLLASLVSCGGGGSATNSSTAALTLALPSHYVLKWEDEFDQPLGPVWDFDLGAPLVPAFPKPGEPVGTVWGNRESQFYTKSADNVFVSNGKLIIQPVSGVPSDAPVRNPPLVATSARIKTDTDEYYKRLNGKPYGFYEIKAKVPCVAGAWPAIWMMGKDGDWPARGEVDIMEWFGGIQEFKDKPNQVQSAVHTSFNNWMIDSPGKPLFEKRDVANMCSEFHRFQLHWSANEILTGVDDVPVFSYKKPINAGPEKWPFDQPAHLLLNVAVGGNLGGEINLNKLPNFKAMTMEVEYIKVWQAP